MTLDSFAADLSDGLSRHPDSVWARDGQALLGWGEAVRIDPGIGADRFDSALRQLRATEAPLALASFTFDENATGSVLVVPEVLAHIDGEGVSYLRGSAADRPPASGLGAMPPGWLEEPGPGDWVAGVQGALAAIRSQEVEKVVLSRTVTARFDEPVSPAVVVTALIRAELGSHTFLVDGFAGSSPELLCSLHDGHVRSTSLAGSAGFGDEADDVLASEKMVLEHDIAADSVHGALLSQCVFVSRTPRRVATYGTIRHLSTSFQGRARAGTRITDLLAALHPTAAVAGSPTKSALELIRELETHERGRYAGPVGWVDRDGDGEFAIALRCGDLVANEATLYIGAGIVEGSDPMAEFDETRIKLRPMMGALGLS